MNKLTRNNKMKNYLLFIGILLMHIIPTNAQNAVIRNDTATYNDRAYTVGDTITLGYGSQANKNFAFIMMGSVLNTEDLDKGFANYEAVIEKLYLQGKTVFVRAKVIDPIVNIIGGNKLFINLQAAIDNKEIK